jgi:hypothetical protein
MHQMSTWTRSLGLCVGAGLAVVALAGCGSSGSTASAHSGSTASTVPAAPAATDSVTASASASTGANTSTSAAGSNACTTADLSLKVIEGAQDNSDQVTASVVLTNTSHSACTTVGYPGVDFFADYGSATQTDLGMHTTREDTGSATTITLAPDGQATSTIQYASGSVCTAGAGTVQVIPPNQVTPLHTGIDFIENGGNPPKGFAVCSTNIDVWPLQSGYDGPHR